MTRHRNIIRAVLIAAFLLIYFADTTRANEPIWPQFRGSNASGLAAEGQNPPVKFGPEQNVLWKTPVPSGHSSPCIWGDRIFLTGFDKEKKELRVFCVDRKDGKIRWSQVVPAEKIERVHSLNTPASATAATDGERVYVYFGSCGFLSYDFEGNQKWRVPLSTRTKYGYSTSPIISGKLVILNHDIEGDAYILAVDCKSGETVWKHDWQRGRICYSTPIVWSEQLIIHRNTEIVALNPVDGSRLWSIQGTTTGTNTPVVGNDTLFVSMWYYFGGPEQRVKLPDFQTLVKKYDKDGDMKIGKTEFPDDLAIARRPELGDDDNVEDAHFFIKRLAQRMFDQNKDGSIDQSEWERIVSWSQGVHTREHGLAAIKTEPKDGVTTAHVLWQEKETAAEVPSPLYYDGRVYMVKNGGIVSCMDAKSGKLLYRKRLGTAGAYYSSPVGAHGRIYIASGKGVITVFAVGDTLQVLARNDMKEKVFATPAVVENKLYVRTVEHMYAFGE